MHVLVAYASRHGSTAGIAERIAEGLRSAGHESEARPVGDIRSLDGFDAFVVGSAAYTFHWLKEATAFVRRHEAELSTAPVWLFSSGPIGTDLVDDQGRDVLEASRPREFEELPQAVGARGTKVFFGAWDPDAPPVGIAERLMRMMPVSRSALPVGDFRDWGAIDDWAAEIADDLDSITIG